MYVNPCFVLFVDDQISHVELKKHLGWNFGAAGCCAPRPRVLCCAPKGAALRAQGLALRRFSLCQLRCTP
ncbi:hypothetical protein A2U01_0057102, partial [Trifolium medium]|nr:hypothetical protein [Trifolium medium]